MKAFRWLLVLVSASRLQAQLDTIPRPEPMGLRGRVARGLAWGAGAGLAGGIIASPSNRGADNITNGVLLGAVMGVVLALPARGERPSEAAIAASRGAPLVPGLRLRARLRTAPEDRWRELRTIRVGQDSVAIVATNDATPYARGDLQRVEVYGGRRTRTRSGLLRGALVGAVVGAVPAVFFGKFCDLEEACSGPDLARSIETSVIGFTLLGATVGGLLGSYRKFDRWIPLGATR
jgi:hypothetical protein